MTTLTYRRSVGRRASDRPLVFVRNMLLNLIFTGAFTVFGVWGYWSFWPYDVLSGFDAGPRPVLNPMVRQGENVVIESGVCKNVNAPGTVVRSFVDGAIYLTPPVAATLSGCREGERVQVPIPVPHSLPPGKWHLSVDIIYQVNPIRTKTYHYTTTDFEVLPARGER